MISISKILVMLRLQGEMNAIVNPNWMTAGFKWMRAVLVETVEGIEHHGWKWWKKQEIDMPQLRMELVDIWHFVLSQLIVDNNKVKSDAEIAEYILSCIDGKNRDIQYNGRTFSSNQSLLEDLELMAGMAAFGDFSICLFSNIMNKTGFTWDELADTYLSKNVLNQFRQRNGYKTGTYVKDWSAIKLTHVTVSGRALEDNDHLHDIMQVIDPSSEKYVEMLMANLQSRYQAVLAEK